MVRGNLSEHFHMEMIDYATAVVTYVIDYTTDLGYLVSAYQSLDAGRQKRLLGYLEALKELPD